MKAKKLAFLLAVIVFISAACSSSPGEMSFFERVWQQNKAVVIVVIILIVVILVVVFLASRKSPAQEAAPKKEAGAAVAEEPAVDKTKLAEEEETVLEAGISGTLTVIVKGEEVGTYNITSTPLILGRDPKAASVVLQSEIVSKSHLKIIPKGDQFYIVDLDSTNGTYVNGEKITETLVNPEDNVQLGKRGDVKLIFKK